MAVVKARPGEVLTFAIPYYSGRDYLRRAIASVLLQSNPNWELIVCDDGGGDAEIAEIVASYGDRRLNYYKNPGRLGMVGNWNRCLELAGTDLVTLLHADDELLEGYADLMLHAAANHAGAVAFFCGARIIDEEGRQRFSFPDYFKRFLLPAGKGPVVLAGEAGLQAILRGNFIMCPTLCYRKSLLGIRRFAPRWQMVQDLDLTSRLLLEGETLVGLSEVGYDYRRHRANATVRYTESLLRFEEEARLYDLLEEQTHGRHWFRAARLARRKGIILLNLAYCALLDLCRLRFRRAQEKAAFFTRLVMRP
jgi:glycosyltransferase involved in cell wall biosynthesis